MFFDIQQSLEVLSVVVYISIQDYGTICVTTYLLHKLPPHASLSIIAGTSHVSCKASDLWSNLKGHKTSPTSLITRCCLNEWMYEDVSVTVHMSCPHSFASEMLRSLLYIDTVQGSTDICLFLVQIQFIYLYLLSSHHHSPTISCDLAILNTFLSTNFGTKTSEHQSSFITYTSWDLFWVTAGPRTIIDG